MDKETLIARFLQKASSRKRLLFAKYGDLIGSYDSIAMIVTQINADLGVENLVSAYDIKYCRQYFMEKSARKWQKIKVPLALTTAPKPAITPEEKPMMQWTNPDTLSKTIIKCKHDKT